MCRGTVPPPSVTGVESLLADKFPFLTVVSVPCVTFPLQIANEMEELGEVQQSECPGSYQNSRIRDLKEAMVSNVVFLSSLRENLKKIHEGREKQW